MNLSLAIHSMGSIGFFPSRAFIPAFVTALLARYGSEIPVIQNCQFVEQIQAVSASASWFTHGLTITILGLLSLIEMIATKDVDLRHFLDELDRFIKPGMSALTSLGLISVMDAEIVESIQQAGIADGGYVLASTAAVFFATKLRHSVLELLIDIDPDDSTGMHRLIGWAEDAWGVFAVVLLFLLPIIMLLMASLVLLGLYLVRRRLEKREEQKRIPCAHCSARIFPCAVTCHHCKKPVAQPCAIGFFGQSRPDVLADVQTLPFLLVEHRRCPVCASRLTQRTPHQHCPVCDNQLADDPGFFKTYDEHIHRRQNTVLAVCLGLGLIPILGLLPAIIYYKIVLVAPYRRYVPRWRTLFWKWVARILTVALALFQWMPLLGAFCIPLMALMNHYLFRRAFLGILEADPAAPAAPRESQPDSCIQQPGRLPTRHHRREHEEQHDKARDVLKATAQKAAITFRCPKCSRTYRVDYSYAGGAATCSDCGTRMRIPEPTQAE